MAKKHNIEKEKQMLLHQKEEKAIQDALKFSQKRFKKFKEVIVDLYNGECFDKFFGTDKRIWKISQCFSDTQKSNKALFRDVLIYLDDISKLVVDEESIQAVYNMVKFRAHWRNDIFRWKPSSKQAEAQMRDLAYYLLCQYKVPPFMYKAFYEVSEMLFVYWFIHLGTGRKIKEMKDIPIPFTQKTGHYLLQASANNTIAEALRWAQVRALGGDEKLANKVAASWLGTKPYSYEEFWNRFLQIVVQGGMFNLNKLTELIDYVREAKRENGAYHLTGRTLQSLLRQSDEWHNRFIHQPKGNAIWKPCGIEGLQLEKKIGLIVLKELTEAKELSEEGRAMKHCVGSYAWYCVHGKTAIFSLRRYASGFLQDTMATIEVNLSLKRIVQAKAKLNKPISDEARKYMDDWANRQGLGVSPLL